MPGWLIAVLVVAAVVGGFLWYRAGRVEKGSGPSAGGGGGGYTGSDDENEKPDRGAVNQT